MHEGIHTPGGNLVMSTCIHIYIISYHISVWQVYALIEGLVDNLCDLMDELDERDEEDIHRNPVNTV